MMRIVAAAALLIAAAVFFLMRGSDERPPADARDGGGVIRACLVQPTCGSKDGKRKEYVHACAAEDDGATDIRTMRGRSCDAI
jgi:hypothetical protein